MSKPNAEEYARVVLWRLAGIEAAMIQLEEFAIAETANVGGEPLETVRLRWVKAKQKNRLDFYTEALRASGIPETGGPSAPPNSESSTPPPPNSPRS